MARSGLEGYSGRFGNAEAVSSAGSVADRMAITRDYDLALYGAAGFTGIQKVKYFSAHAPDDRHSNSKFKPLKARRPQGLAIRVQEFQIRRSHSPSIH